MEQYFVYLPMRDYSGGCMDHGVLVDAETTDDAIYKANIDPSNMTAAFPDTTLEVAVRVPDHLIWLPNEEKLEYYMGLAKALGEKAFYRQVMKVKGYKPHKGPKHKFFIDDVEVSESEWYAR